MKFLFFSIFLLANLTSVQSQTFGDWQSSRRILQCERISLEHGLSESIIEGIVQDQKGFLWFATEDGLNRYDGYSFKIFRLVPGDSTSLSHNEIKSLYVDRAGVLWVGTFDGGLNRYDSELERFTRFKHEPDNPASLSNNIIRCIYEDRSGNLWIGTQGGGLNRAIRESGQVKFMCYKNDPANPQSLSHDDVSVIYQDRVGRLWIGTSGGGLNCLTVVPDKSDSHFQPAFTRFQFDSTNSNTLSHNDVRAIAEDHRGNLWIGTFGGGLNRLTFSAGSQPEIRFARYQANSQTPGSLSSNFVLSILKDSHKTMWVGTDGNGLNKLNFPDSENSEPGFTCFQNDRTDNQSLSSNRIYALFEDRSGVLWIGTYGAGINKVNLKQKKFLHYESVPDNSNSLNHPIVWAIYEDRFGVLWIGTNDGGLNRLERNPRTGEPLRYTYFTNNPDNSHSLSHNSVRVICEDHAGDFWIGTNGGGLNWFHPENNSESLVFKHFRADPDNPHSLSDDKIRAIYEDRKGNLWIGTLGGGLNQLIRPEAGDNSFRFVHYRHHPENAKSLSSDFVRAICEDQQGDLWIGTQGGGLNQLSLAEQQKVEPEFIHFKNDPENPATLSNDYVFSILEDSDGSLWIGTFGGGLNKFNRASGTFSCFRKEDGLPSNAIYGILAEPKHAHRPGYFWLSTNNGLSRFNPQTGEFRNYSLRDGLQSNEFNGGAYFMSRRGEFFFGGINGFNAFFPEDIIDNPFIPPVVITDFKLFNASVPIDRNESGDKILTKSIVESSEITLSYSQNVFSFEFAALDFTIPEKNQFRYQMAGFDEDWVQSGARNFVTYTNLNPGEYTFKLSGSNNDGVWNETGTSLKIIITPPFWQTWWFRIISALIVVLTGLGLYRKRVNAMEARRKLLEIQVDEKTKAAEALQNALSEVERLKNRLQAENIYLQDEIRLEHNFSDIICYGEPFKIVLQKVEQVAATDATVLILGESGTGKELLARAIHSISNRSKRPLVKVNCAALPASLIESELFGHEKGAFTGATSRKTGRFELADGGTIFLDEIGDLPIELQAKLLRVLQDGEFERLGSSATISVDVRVIAATNHELEKEVKINQFRPDLFYRLNVFPIKCPPLRERKEDIPLLVKHFIKKYGNRLGRKIESIPKNVIEQLSDYPWPGNVRELENIIERAVIISHGKNLVLGDWLPKLDLPEDDGSLISLEDNERRHILAALEKTDWRVSGEKGAARILGINPKTLESRMKKLNISRLKD